MRRSGEQRLDRTLNVCFLIVFQEAVEKYEEVLHNLEFAKELQKTFSGLSQDLLKAQKKAQRREHLLKLEAEKKKLRTIFQVQYVLQNFTQEHVQEDFKGGSNGALYLPSRELDYLIKFSKLTCPERNESLSVEDQMEQSSLYFWDLLEGSEKAVVGTTYKHMKDLLSKLLTSGYFESVPVPRNSVLKQKEEVEGERPGKSEKKPSLPPDSTKESESLMECTQPEIQPQEFLNRRYLSEVQFSSQKPEAEPPWEEAYAGKARLTKCWEMLADLEGPPEREPPGSWDPAMRQEAAPAGSAPGRLAPEGPESPGRDPQGGPEAQEAVPGPWEADGPPPSAACGPEEQESREPQKPWAAPLHEAPEPEKRPPKSWAPATPSEQKAAGSWPAPVHEEPWEARAEGQKRPLLQPVQPPSKAWGPPGGLVGSGQRIASPYAAEPREVSRGSFASRERAESASRRGLRASPSPPRVLPAFCASRTLPAPRSALAFVPAFWVPPLLDEATDAPPTLPKDSALRKEKLQDLMTQIQGTYNFMQESVLDFDQPPSAVPSPQLPSGIPDSPEAPVEQPRPGQSDFLQEPSQVFHVNAPLPPRTEQEMKDSPYSGGYNQSFTTASTQTPPQCQLPSLHVEQTPLSQEQTANCQPDGAIQVSSGSPAFYPAQSNVFPRSTPSYLSNRGSIRGCPRGGRSLPNSFRSSAGYKGFDTYRGSLVIANGSYGQLQFQAREYPGTPYSQRDSNFQQCYKRGGISSGPRTSSRAGWSDSSQVNSPERENETFTSVDSGQGDSRSLTPVDVPVTSPAATILPVHVYPLPQQMRVAFSAARTSNLAPGTLDQPIVFDLLLNNLGETFDLQLGRFNCPVNGTYVFIFHMLKLAVNVPLYVNLMKNEEVLVSAYANDGAPDHETASNHAILQLFQGDQIWLRLHRGAIYGSSWKYSTFSGYLLYQD
ncbi:caprin-2 [Gracilinanus agilis]|uniref:caprin-2 n=1 Tax=Gracilinanus agilis TaxID=191870 RepID=UPI001CFEB7D4|nr:caprin-2 [Gracilinanus agilis]